MRVLPILLFVVQISFPGLNQGQKIFSKQKNIQPAQILLDTNKKPINAHGSGVLFYEGIYYRNANYAGYNAEFIGPNTYKHVTKNIKNAGFSGKEAEYLDEITDSIYNKYPADIVLLHTGHNHFAEEKPVARIIAAQKSIISKILAINPKVTIFLAQVITSGKLPKYSYIPALNAQIANLVIEFQKKGLPVVLVNQAKNFNWQIHCLKDKVHPNAKGAALMANTWFESIDKKLKQSSLQKQK